MRHAFTLQMTQRNQNIFWVSFRNMKSHTGLVIVIFQMALRSIVQTNLSMQRYLKENRCENDGTMCVL